MYLCCIYNVPSNSPLNNNNEIDFFECIETDVEKYSSLGKVIINGDFNSRTSTANDYISFDEFLDNPEIFETDTIFLPRKNQDQILDSYGRKLLNLCKNTGLLIANGRINNGDFTF